MASRSSLTASTISSSCFLNSQFQHFTCIVQAVGQFIQRGDDGFQPSPLTTQFLGFFRVVPDVRIFQFPAYFLQPVTLVRVVKDTP